MQSNSIRYINVIIFTLIYLYLHDIIPDMGVRKNDTSGQKLWRINFNHLTHLFEQSALEKMKAARNITDLEFVSASTEMIPN